jgi:hypothetical protein
VWFHLSQNPPEEEDLKKTKLTAAPEAFTQPQTVADRKPKKRRKN